MDTFNKLADEIHEWQTNTFPDSNPVAKIFHLQKETWELIDALNEGAGIHEEFADCFILLIGAAKAFGYTNQEILKVIRHKFEINKRRTWGTPDKDGVVKHIEDEK